MKMELVLFTVVLSMTVVTSSVFAGHDHGSHNSTIDHGASQGTRYDQYAKENETVINNCAQLADRIQQHIWRLQAEIKRKQVGNSTRDELKKLEENLKEISENVRSLHIM